MRTPFRRFLRAATLGMVLTASSVVTAPAQAEPFIYPPIYDPFREIKEKVNETREAVEDLIPADPVGTVTDMIPSDPVGTVNDAIAAGVTGKCLFQGGTIEGAALSSGVPDTTGVVCRIYDEQGVMRGGCAMFTPGVTAACAAPTEVVLGPPTVCTETYAVYSWGTIHEGWCE